mgnify:CR=1 FL=1
MKPTICSRCKKNIAVIFITKVENGVSTNEGLCLKCARELKIKQVDDIVERMGSEIADKSLAARRAFSLDGLKELDALYEQLLSNLKLAMSVFFSGDVTSARRLRRSKHRFRILNRRYSHAHVDRLHQQNVQSIETSSLHLGLLGDMQRLNSLFCSVAYSVLEQPDEDEGRDEY